MRAEKLALLACPQCGGDLEITSVSEGDPWGEIRDGAIACTACGGVFGIRNHIARFVPASSYADSFGFQWAQHADTQLDSRNGYTLSRDRFFRATGWRPDLAGELILEVGSGAGRFTEIASSTGAEIVTFDYSTAIDVNLRNNGVRPDITYVQADIYRLPFKKDRFDKIFCLGVLQHTPDVGRAFHRLPPHLRPGGEITVDCYQRTLRAILHWKYLLRPLTRRMDRRLLYRLVSAAVPPLLPAWRLLYRLFGKAGTRFLPITSYGHLGIDERFNRDWSILDTFDMYSPAHDHPQTLRTIRRWFHESGLRDIDVAYGPNGIVGRGRRDLDRLNPVAWPAGRTPRHT